MAKSSINFKKSSAHSSAHNLRIDEPSYLLPIEFRLENESWQNSKSDKELFELELKNSNRKGGPKPKLENSRWEAVLNLNKNHSLEDVQKVAEHIAKKFNITPTEITIHRDEGHIENGKPVYNFHAHLNFLTYKDGKQNWRKELIKPAALSELQTEVSQILGMERGRVNSKAKRLDHRQYKAVAQEMQYNFREYQQKITALEELTTEQKRELHQLNSAVKNHKATIEELQERIVSLRSSLFEKEEKIDELDFELLRKDTKIDELQNDVIAQRETILEQKTTIDTQKDSLNDLTQDMSVITQGLLDCLPSDKLELDDLIAPEPLSVWARFLDSYKTPEMRPEANSKEKELDELYDITKQVRQESTLKSFIKNVWGRVQDLTRTVQEQASRIMNLEEENSKLKERLFKAEHRVPDISEEEHKERMERIASQHPELEKILQEQEEEPEQSTSLYRLR